MANGQVNQIFNVLQTIVQENNVTSEKTWLQEHLSDARLRPIVARTSVVGLHILSGLENGQRKGIDLAEDLNVTRGGIYRAAQSLEQLGLITSQHAADNKKNRYYALTDDGQIIARIHDRMHHEMNDQLFATLEAQFSEADLATVLRFLQTVSGFKQDFGQGED